MASVKLATIVEAGKIGVGVYRRLRKPQPVTNSSADRQLERLEAYLRALLEQGAEIMTGLERLTKEVAETKDAVKTAVALIVKMVPAIPEEALNALADSLDADQKALLDAVQASGTVEPPATPEV
jgi:hypothetical protein